MRCWSDTATVTGRRITRVDTSVRGADFSWPPVRTSRGHQRGPHLAIRADFFMATDTRCDLDAQPSDDPVGRRFDLVEPGRLWVMDVAEHPDRRGQGVSGGRARRTQPSRGWVVRSLIASAPSWSSARGRWPSGGASCRPARAWRTPITAAKVNTPAGRSADVGAAQGWSAQWALSVAAYEPATPSPKASSTPCS
jgi:hypothetical protein